MQVFFEGINQQAFEGRYPKGIFYDVRDIPNLTCAKCGEKMIRRQEAESFLSKIRPALSVCLKKSKELQQSKEFPLLDMIAKMYPKENIDKVLSHTKVEEIKKIPIFVINIIKRITYNAPLVVKRLQKYKNYMSDAKLELLDLMEVYAKRYPDKNFEEIVEIPNVYNYHLQRVLMEKALLEQKAQKVFAKMEKVVHKYGKECLEDLRFVNIDVAKTIKNRTRQDDSEEFLEQLYKNVLSKITNEKDNDIFRKYINELPIAELNADRIIVRLADTGSSNGMIYHLLSRTNTFEHIIPQSKKGANTPKNGLCMCAECNGRRGTLPYTKEFQMLPDFGKHIQRQLSTVMRYILHGKLLHYDTYPQEVKKTLYKESGNTFKLNIKKYTEAQIEKTKKNIEEKKERIRNTNRKLYNVNRNIERLLNKQKKLKKDCTSSHQILKQEKNKLEMLKQSLNEDLDSVTEVHE